MLRFLVIFSLSQCVSVITVCFRHHSMFPSSLCVSVITVCFLHHCVFLSSQCVSVISVCFYHHSMFLLSKCVTSSQCVYIIKVYFCPHMCFCHHSIFRNHRVYLLSQCVFIITVCFIFLSGVYNRNFCPCFAWYINIFFLTFKLVILCPNCIAYHWLINSQREGRAISRQNLNEYIRTLNLASTQFCYLPTSHCKNDFKYLSLLSD